MQNSPSDPTAAAGRSGLLSPMVVAVNALGLTQITAWGTSYYCLGVLAAPVGKELGWSRGFVFLGFTVAVLVMGLISTHIGRLIDRIGARAVMSVGSIIVAMGLYLLSCVTQQWAYLAVWVLIGIGMRCCLYDAAFAALVQVAPGRGRQAISYLTLYGAFASSVFWVVGHYLEEAMGWRQTLVVFALLNLLVCLPLHWLGLARREVAKAEVADEPRPVVATTTLLEGRARTLAIWLFALVMSLNGLVFGIVSVQLVPLLEAAGLATAAAVWMASLKGVAQFAGRVVEIAFGSKLSAMAVGRISIAVVPVSFALLYLSNGSFAVLLAFTLLMGAAQGVLTIVRGAVPLALFGAKGYGAVLGLIATPVLLVSAASPTLFAALVDRWGWTVGHVVMLGSSVAAMLCMETMARWHRTSVARQAQEQAA
ncbi:MAG: MFS transporter [Hyphomicrobiaceae bacterium]|nr:MFS transporter [Hyphomicrobiaceae bacterium]